MNIKNIIENEIANTKADIHHVEYTFKKLFNRDLRTELNGNRMFKNIHSGKRCFVVGNGPSIKSQDLSFLKNEFVFCVNQCTRNDQFFDMNPNYYVCIDRNFFRINPDVNEDKELLDAFIRLSECNEMKCFFPYEVKDSFIKSFELDRKLDVHYIKQGMNLCENFRPQMDISNAIPFFGTVVQTAIAIAIYMGFSEIYLLGCDETGIVVTINSILKKSNQDFYSYNVTDNENKRMETMVERSGLEQYSRAYYHTVAGFRLLYEYCNNRGIKLVNCSAESVIDSLPRIKYEEVVLNNENKR